MALSASAMVTLIDEEIERRLDPDQAAGVKKAASGENNFEMYSLDELRKLRATYKSESIAAANPDTGGLQFTKITNASPSA